MVINRHRITTTVNRPNISILSSITLHTIAILSHVTLKWYVSTTLPLKTLQRAFYRGFKVIYKGDPPTPLYMGGGRKLYMPLLTRGSKPKMVFQVFLTQESKRKPTSWILPLLSEGSKPELTPRYSFSLYIFYTVIAFCRLMGDVNFEH